MLDQDTKRRIDGCRDILVGKVPDPKSQVEQITIALIYKFMDDMDRESVVWWLRRVCHLMTLVMFLLGRRGRSNSNQQMQ